MMLSIRKELEPFLKNRQQKVAKAPRVKESGTCSVCSDEGLRHGPFKTKSKLYSWFQSL